MSESTIAPPFREVKRWYPHEPQRSTLQIFGVGEVCFFEQIMSSVTIFNNNNNNNNNNNKTYLELY